MMRDEELSVYQIVECLVTNYGYQILNTPEQKPNEVWLANNQKGVKYPIIRLNSLAANTVTFEQEYLSKIKQVGTLLSGRSDILIINTNVKSEEFSEGDVRQLLFTNSLKNQEVIDNFPLLMQYVKPSANNDNEVVQIKKRLQNFQQQMRKKFLKSIPKPKNSIKVIIGLVIGYIALIALRMVLPELNYDAFWIVAGSQYKSFTMINNEWWRFITSFFLSPSIFTLLLNSLIIYMVGRVFEQLYKPKTFWLLFIACLIVPPIAGYILDPNVIILGPANLIMGMIGGVVGNFISTGKIKTLGAKANLFNLVLFSIVVITAPYVSMYECLVGFIIGLGFGLYHATQAKYVSWKPHLLICSVLLVLGMGYAATRVDVAQPINNKIDNAVLDCYQKQLHQGDYAKKMRVELDKLEDME